MKTINVSNATYDLIKDQLTQEEKTDISSMEDLVGKKLFIRTVTYHAVGKVEKIIGNFLELSGASWVADSGRFSNAIKNGTLEEVEPIGTYFVNAQTIVDFIPWVHDLPTEQK